MIVWCSLTDYGNGFFFERGLDSLGHKELN